MFKSTTLALAAVTLAIGSAKANDLMDDLAGMALATINDSAAAVEEFDLAEIDMDGLEANAGGEDSDAIEACFRRIGYRRGGWGHEWGRGYGWRGGFHRFGRCYSYCHRPMYCYRPIVSHCYSYCQPVVTSYWGCF